MGDSEIDLSSTGPTMPTDEDLLRLLRISVDLQAMNAALAVNEMALKKKSASGTRSGIQEDLNTLQEQIDSGFMRLSADTQFLSDLANKIGEAGFEEAFTRAELDPQVRASLQEKASQRGGLVALLQALLSNGARAFSEERLSMNSAIDALKITNPDEEGPPPEFSSPADAFLCVYGASEMVAGTAGVLGGVALVATGLGAPEGAVAVAGSAALLTSGSILVGGHC